MTAVLNVAMPARADPPKDDKQTLATLAVQWAVTGGLAEFQRVPAGADLIVAKVNLPAGVSIDLPGRKAVMMSLARIQAQADIKGDTVYFRLGPINGNAQRATLPVALLWAASIKNPAAAVTGSGALLEFEKHDGKWQRVNVTGEWAH